MGRAFSRLGWDGIMAVKDVVFLVLAAISISCADSEFGLDTEPTQVIALSRQLSEEFHGSFSLSPVLNGDVREVELNAFEFEAGVRPPYLSRVWGYNQRVPGPVIRMALGETLEVKLTNNLPQPTSIHWHGVRVPNSMDGVPGLTQKAVPLGKSFVYRFTPKDAGTFWFHPHFRSSEQVEKGLHGVLIVEDPADPPYSAELVWMLDDWLLEKDGSIYDQFVTRHDLAHDGRWGNFLTVNGQYRPVFRVNPGDRIRIRMVNVANGRVFLPVISGMESWVIMVDGLAVAEPFPLGDFDLAPGNRLDLDLVVPANSAGRTFAVENRFSRQPSLLAFLQVATQKAGDTPSFDLPRAGHFPDWKEAKGIPVHHEFILDAERGGIHGISWTIDGRTWPGAQVLELRAGQFYRLRFTNRSSRLHPMHLHGQFFRLLSRNERDTDERFWRDTVLVGPRESVDIGLVPTDPGLWANHCHVLEHAEAGMMTAVRVN